MAAKKVKLEAQYPEDYAFALELVQKVRREFTKKYSVSKSATELVQKLLDYKAK